MSLSAYLMGKQEIPRIVQQVRIHREEANKTSRKAAKVMTGRMQEDKSQSGITYSHGQEEEEKTLSQLAIFDKDPLVN